MKEKKIYRQAVYLIFALIGFLFFCFEGKLCSSRRTFSKMFLFKYLELQSGNFGNENTFRYFRTLLKYEIAVIKLYQHFPPFFGHHTTTISSFYCYFICFCCRCRCHCRCYSIVLFNGYYFCCCCCWLAFNILLLLLLLKIVHFCQCAKVCE